MQIQTIRSALTRSARLVVLLGIFCALGIGILRAEDRRAVSSAAAVGIDLGDINCDGALNGADIDVFFLALVLPENYTRSFPNCHWKFGDINQDEHLDGADIDLFFACLEARRCLP